MSNAFDEWFEESHRCDLNQEQDYCLTHDSYVHEGTVCDYVLEDPLYDPHDVAVEDALIDEAESL